VENLQRQGKERGESEIRSRSTEGRKREERRGERRRQTDLPRSQTEQHKERDEREVLYSSVGGLCRDQNGNDQLLIPRERSRLKEGGRKTKERTRSLTIRIPHPGLPPLQISQLIHNLLHHTLQFPHLDFQGRKGFLVRDGAGKHKRTEGKRLSSSLKELG